MKVAVTFEDGQVFQHFGHTENFKVYEVENGLVMSAEVVPAGGAGHDALAGFLTEQGIDVLICGGMGSGAHTAVTEAGIELYAGVSGDADEAVMAYLAGELISTGANCDHHDEDHHCGGEEGGCGGGCGSCGGGCGGAPQIIMEGKNAGKLVRVHYRGTFNDGSQFDSSYDRGEPLEFICATGRMIRGFDAAVVNMEVGEEVDIHLMPEEAYGPKDPNMIFEIETAMLPGSEELQVGMKVYLQDNYGRPFPADVVGRTETTVTFDCNSEMAGKELNFHIELLSAE